MRAKIFGILLFALPVVAGASFFPNASSDQEFEEKMRAYKYWLGKQVLLDTEKYADDIFQNYYHLHSIALYDLLNDPQGKWKIHRMTNYDYRWMQTNVGYSDLPMSNEGAEKQVPTAVYYFIYKGDIKAGEHLVVRPTRTYRYFPNEEKYFYADEVWVFSRNDQESVKKEFLADLSKYIYEKNIYRSKVLEFVTNPNMFQASYKIRFFRNLEGFKYQWDDLVLNADLKQKTQDLTQGFANMTKVLEKFGRSAQKGVLLAGPPGTGKSFVGKVLVSSTLRGVMKDKVTLMIVTARHLTFKHAIRTMFLEAARLSPTIVFMEDIDLLGIKQRENRYQRTPVEKEDILNEFLNAIDGVVDHKGLVVIGTTNRIEAVDPALLRSGRLGLHFYYGYPKFTERREFFVRYAKRKAAWKKNLDLNWLIGASEGLSGADILEAIQIARQVAYLAGSMKGEEMLLGQEHFEEAFQVVRQGLEKNDTNFLQPNASPEPDQYFDAFERLMETY